MNLFNDSETLDALSLSELNEQVQEAINELLPGTYWIQAETSDVRINAASGHCYLEFIEKNQLTGQIVAKARGAIWARTFHILKPYFEESTKQAFVSGLKVLVKISVEFHKLYGFSLTVHEIDPSYTIGDLIKKRMEIVRRLQEEGIFELNQELPFPVLPQRIALISSPTAAGYEDFVNQLLQNKAGYPFYLKLFPATMQGEKTEESIIEALDRICSYTECFDVVVLIRGGGSASDLNCFDSYLLAAHCAQFPLPLITGIGHERDDSIVDMVAHTRMKTPTAVAAFLIGCMDEQANALNDLQQIACANASEIISNYQSDLKWITAQLPAIVTYLVERNRTHLLSLAGDLSATHLFIERHHSSLLEVWLYLQSTVSMLFSDKNKEMELLEQYLKMASPDYILKRGYALALKDGKIIKHVAELDSGDEFVTRFADGELVAVVK